MPNPPSSPPTNRVIPISRLPLPDSDIGDDYDLAAPPQRSLMQRAAYPPRISLNSILLSLLCTIALVVVGFLPMSLPSPLNIGSEVQTYADLSMIQYTAQLPFALFIGAFLGPYMGTTSVLLFLIIGLFVAPVFSNGGGWQYISQPGFGYLLACLPFAYLVGRTFYQAFQKQNHGSRSLKIIMTALAGTVGIHMVGILYLLGLSLAGIIGWVELPGWLLRLSVETLPYDILATGVLLCLVRQVRLGLWLVLY